MCSYGASFVKPTAVVSDLPELAALTSTCQCNGCPHEHLQGLAVLQDSAGRRRTVWKTKLAGRYPPRLARRIASILLHVALPVGSRLSSESNLVEIRVTQPVRKNPYTTNPIGQDPLSDAVFLHLSTVQGAHTTAGSGGSFGFNRAAS